HAPAAIDYRDGEQMMGPDEIRYGFLIHVTGRRHEIGVHHVPDHRFPVCGEESAEADDSKQMLLVIEHVGVVDGFYRALGRLTAKITDRSVDGHIRAEAHETRAH